jgi:hypothetical protein
MASSTTRRMPTAPAVGECDNGRGCATAGNIPRPYRALGAQPARVLASEEVKQRFETGGKGREIGTSRRPFIGALSGVTRG